MPDSSPLAGLLDRAGNVFSLAGKLGRAFHEEGQSRAKFFDPSIWQRHAPTFDKFCAALLDLREAMQNPPDGFAPVAERLMQAAKLAKGIRDTLARDGGFTAYLDYFPDLNTVFQAGWDAVKEATKTRRLDDPFAFVDHPAATALSLLDRFPSTPAGHVAFLEFVRDEVHNAAEVKRGQLEHGYPNATIESMVRGVKWSEARQRLDALSELPADTVERVARVLRRELSVGTVERIEELLAPAIRHLREAMEEQHAGRAKPTKRPESTSDHIAALHRLKGALDAFRNSGWQSEGSANDEPTAGMDPDDLDCESVEPGGEIHNAVCEVQKFYSGKLPAPVARNPWRNLLHICRWENDDFKRQNNAHEQAAALQTWVESEITRLEGVQEAPSRRAAAAEALPAEGRDDFDRLGIAADLTAAARVANRCLLDSYRLAHSIVTSASLIAKQRELGRSRNPTDPQIEFPRSMCEDGAAAVARLSESCRQLSLALAQLGSVHVGVMQGTKRLGSMNGISYHDAVLNWTGNLVAEVIHGVWRAGGAPIVSGQDKVRIAEQWPLIAESAAKSENVVRAQEDVDRVLPLIVEEAVNAHRQRENMAGSTTPPLVGQKFTGKSRIVLGTVNTILLDGNALAVKPNGYRLFELLLEAPGEYVPMANHGLRTRDVESLPEALRDAVESDPGAGTRIKREYLA